MSYRAAHPATAPPAAAAGAGLGVGAGVRTAVPQGVDVEESHIGQARVWRWPQRGLALSGQATRPGTLPGLVVRHSCKKGMYRGDFYRRVNHELAACGF